jgi:Pyridoxamine 5'-phosphate oxidase
MSPEQIGSSVSTPDRSSRRVGRIGGASPPAQEPPICRVPQIASQNQAGADRVGHDVPVEDAAGGRRSYLLEEARDLASREAGLAIVVTHRADGSAHASVVNAGVVDHPVSGERAVGFVVQGGARKKLENLRVRRTVTVVFRSGWEWVAVEGTVDLIGPDDRDCLPWPGSLAVFHEIYSAAIGGSPDDWPDRDHAIEQERHAAVLVRPVRVYSNPSRA